MIGFILCMHFWYYLIPYLIIMYFVRRKLKWIDFVVIGIYLLLFITGLPNASHVSGKLLITYKEQKDEYYQYEVRDLFHQYTINLNENLLIGDIINIDAKIEKYRKLTNFRGFDSYSYYLSKGIDGKLVNFQYEKKNSLSFLHWLNQDNVWIDFFKDIPFIDDELYGYLFSFSSLHLSVILIGVQKIFYYLDLKDSKKDLILTCLLSICYLIGQSVLILRLLLTSLIRFMLHKLEWDIDRMNVEITVFILILCINPYVIYNHTFLLLYIIIFLNLFKSIQSFITNQLMFILIFIPFLLLWNGKIDVLLLLFMPIIYGMLKYTFVPSLFIYFLFPMIKLSTYMQESIVRILEFVKTYDLSIFIPRFTNEWMVLYLLTMILLYASKSLRTYFVNLMLSLSILICFIIIQYATINDSVYFIDVGQGDGAVIIKNNYVIVVDAFDGVSDYLYYMGIDRINYLILTHHDLDHIKEADSLIETFKVDVLVLSGYQDYPVNHPNILRINQMNLPTIESIELKFLGPVKNYNNANANSIVFQINVQQEIYLFTGDIDKSVELDLINIYGHKLKSDIIKVPHHGSNTSSGELFLSYVNPRLAIISVGIKNRYNQPHPEIVELYQSFGIQIHLTSLDGAFYIEGEQSKKFSPY